MNAYLSRAELLMQQRRYELAEEQLRLALSNGGDSFRAHALLALCLLEREKFDEAVREAQQAIHDAPDEAFGFYALATVQFHQDRLDEARTAINEAIRLEPWNSSFFNILAGIEAQQYHWTEALSAAEQGLACDPDDVGCNNLRAIALVNLGRKAEAGRSIDATLAKNPDDAVTHANQGWTLLHQQQPKKAMEHFREALRLQPDLEWARLGIVEAMKARFFIYRWLLTWFLWLQRFSPNVRLGLMLGLIFGRSILASLLQMAPMLEPLVTPLTVAYVLFVWMTWTAPSLFNLVLRMDSFGRLVLNDDERLESTLVGVCLIVCLLCGMTSLFFDRSLAIFSWRPAMLYLGLMLPLIVTLRQPPGQRQMMTIYTVGLALCILVATYHSLSFSTLVSPWLNEKDVPADKLADLKAGAAATIQWFEISIWGIVISTWIGAGFSVSRSRPRSR